VRLAKDLLPIVMMLCVWVSASRHFGALDATAIVSAIWLLMPYQEGKP
jgi:hypothetical protein